jgi:hypothetical protein
MEASFIWAGARLSNLPVATEPLMLCNGGSSAFGIEYDVDTRSVTHFAVNGRF